MPRASPPCSKTAPAPRSALQALLEAGVAGDQSSAPRLRGSRAPIRARAAADASRRTRAAIGAALRGLGLPEPRRDRVRGGGAPRRLPARRAGGRGRIDEAIASSTRSSRSISTAPDGGAGGSGRRRPPIGRAARRRAYRRRRSGQPDQHRGAARHGRDGHGGRHRPERHAARTEPVRHGPVLHDGAGPVATRAGSTHPVRWSSALPRTRGRDGAAPARSDGGRARRQPTCPPETTDRTGQGLRAGVSCAPPQITLRSRSGRLARPARSRDRTGRGSGIAPVDDELGDAAPDGRRLLQPVAGEAVAEIEVRDLGRPARRWRCGRRGSGRRGRPRRGPGGSPRRPARDARASARPAPRRSASRPPGSPDRRRRQSGSSSAAGETPPMKPSPSGRHHTPVVSMRSGKAREPLAAGEGEHVAALGTTGMSTPASAASARPPAPAQFDERAAGDRRRRPQGGRR